MSKSYKTPGVYIEETPNLPPAIVPTNTAVPVFIGYTQFDKYNDQSLINVPTKISNLLEFEKIFGKAKPQHITVELYADQQSAKNVTIDDIKFNLYYALQLYFQNSGEACYIVSCGNWNEEINETTSFEQQVLALKASNLEAAITIVVLADAFLAGKENFYQLYKQALQECYIMQNRVVIIDLFAPNKNETFKSIESEFRQMIGEDHLSFGVAYYPYLQTSLQPYIDEAAETIVLGKIKYKLRLTKNSIRNKSLFHEKPVLYNSIKTILKNKKVVLPPSAVMAGIYCMMDKSRGIWKAPANVALNGIEKLMQQINDQDHELMNVHSSGKSVNAIRHFTGKGILVWGARTLKGNDNEWRYINVKRLNLWIIHCINTSTDKFVMEPNDSNSWLRIKVMIENFLINIWRQGGLMGSKPEEAFFVNIGLNQTMTALDINEGRMIIEIGVAPLRPAEFIISRVVKQMSMT